MGKWRARGIRGNNPLNIRFNARNTWLGRVPPAENTDPGKTFEQFESPVMGLRAGVKLILRHQEKRGANTIAKLIQIWAPPNENNTLLYADKVASHAGKDRDEIVDFRDYKTIYPVLEAMISVENGNMPYKPWELNEALLLAGIKIQRI